MGKRRSGPGPDQADEQSADFWEVARPDREPASAAWFLPAVIAVLTVATPWYLPQAVAERLVGGLPVWVWVALSGALVLSILTAYGALFLWRNGSELEPAGGDSDG